MTDDGYINSVGSSFRELCILGLSLFEVERSISDDPVDNEANEVIIDDTSTDIFGKTIREASQRCHLSINVHLTTWKQAVLLTLMLMNIYLQRLESLLVMNWKKFC